MSEAACGGEPPAEIADQPAGKSRRAFDRDLLTENRSRRELETVPATRYA